MHTSDAFFMLVQASLQGLREMLREVAVLGSYRHQHLVPLVCFCLSRQSGVQEACLVYPLMARGGLDQALADRATRPLGAAARLRIAADAAAGLSYLHAPGGGLAAILHRDVKSSNVLLDEGMRARVGDVGLARPQRGAAMTAGVGTFGYFDPEYVETGACPHPAAQQARSRSDSFASVCCASATLALHCSLISSASVGPCHFVAPGCGDLFASCAAVDAAGEYTPASDAFSFGVVLMELLTGAPSVDATQRPPNLYARMRVCLPHQAETVADSLAGWPALVGGGSAARGLGALALRCVETVGSRRPSLAEVLGQVGGNARWPLELQLKGKLKERESGCSD